MKFLVLICFTAIALSNAFSVNPSVGLMGRLCSRIHVEPDNFGLIQNMQYPNTPDVHEFLKCTLESIELWNDETGYQVNMLDTLLKDHDLYQAIKDEFERCNRETRQENPANWAYEAFLCVLNGPMSGKVTEIIQRILRDLGAIEYEYL